MTATEKIALLTAELQKLSDEYGDYSLRRAWKRYHRERFTKQIKRQSAIRSVWRQALRPLPEETPRSNPDS